MKNLLAVVAIFLSVLVIYTVHQDRVKKAAESAAPPSRSFGMASRRVVPLSEVLDPHFKNLVMSLEKGESLDLVPPLQIIKQRTTEKRREIDPSLHPLCDEAVRCLDLMIAAGEERTQALEAALRIAARPPSALDEANVGTSANAFFLKNALKRWQTEIAKRRPAIEQSMNRLRTAESDWKKAFGETMPPVNFFPGIMPPVYVTIEETESNNPLERSAYGHQRPWRRSFYDQYGNGSTLSY
jgi:hypothetical protein